jgi:lipid II:glycine glycyltransferase (peptidoglycan interpeptide bridge formation enzyme)
MAQQSGVGVGGVIAIAFGQRCWFLYGASNGEVRHVFPNETLHWEMIKWAKAKGCVCYDLGGTGTDYPVPTESEDYPLFHFKKGFGAQVVYLTGYYDLIFRPALYRMFRFAEEMLLPWSVKIAARSQKLREVIF